MSAAINGRNADLSGLALLSGTVGTALSPLREVGCQRREDQRRHANPNRPPSESRRPVTADCAKRRPKRYSSMALNPAIADLSSMDRMAHFRDRLARSTRGVGVRQVRLASGLVLFAYLVSHFVNHALGNISMEALAGGVYWHTLFWQFLPVAMVFDAACLVHTALGVWALYERRQFRWKAIEPLQLVLGLSVPALIITHIIGVRLGHTLFGHEKLYPQVFFAYWIVWPWKAPLMFAVFLISWIHGCIGLGFWLRVQAFHKTAAPYLLAAAALAPPLAMLGRSQ